VAIIKLTKNIGRRPFLTEDAIPDLETFAIRVAPRAVVDARPGGGYNFEP
jgi:hypothetical protein